MTVRRPIRTKLFIGLGLLLLVVGLLSGGGLYTTYTYRGLVKSLSTRVSELPVAAELSQHVSDLRVTLGELQGLQTTYKMQPPGVLGIQPERLPARIWLARDLFRSQLDSAEETLARYRRRLDRKLAVDVHIADNQAERDTVEMIEAALGGVREASNDHNWMVESDKITRLETELDQLQTLTSQLPSYLHSKLVGIADEARGEYRVLIIGTWLTSVTAGLLLALLVRLFFTWILAPLRTLLGGSRRVASGEFGYRIPLETDDEMAELAQALNDMTARFQAIRDDLDRQVQERTRQAVRSEQLASVGFLAAGVAHEINNPLASIAMCAESLESRVHGVPPLVSDPAQADLAAKYLTMIQNEAFRCKEITEKLLDFARVGPRQRQEIELGELVQGVIDMLGHIGKYQAKSVAFACERRVVAPVNPQEIKQVVLNLLTNALDSLDDDGSVTVRLSVAEGAAELLVSDTGCGMDEAVLEHIFEPFFTRRRAGQGQGTGLGLSISYRIVSDHGGEIEAHSPGPGLGSTFRVRLPLATASAARAIAA